MKLDMQVGLGPGHIVLDGAQLPSAKRGIAPNFRPMSVVAKRLDGSRCHSITVILFTTTYLSLRSPASNRSRTLLPVLLLKLLNAVTSLLSYTLFIGSK